MTSQERQQLRARIDAAQRDKLQVPTCPNGYGSQYGYKKRGCRCPDCRRAVAAAKRLQRARVAA